MTHKITKVHFHNFLYSALEYGTNASVWELKLQDSDGTYERNTLLYGVDRGQFHLSYVESEDIYVVPYPFTIGVKYDTLNKEDYQSKQEIMETYTTVILTKNI